MLIDTHCHLDAAEFDADRGQVVRHARAAGVRAIVIPAVERANFAVVRALAWQVAGGAYALGIHPLYTQRAADADLEALRQAIRQSLDDPRFVAVGEIGLDFFVPELASGQARARQERFYAAQLALAAQFKLPVLLHGRKSQDILLKYLRRHERIGGIAHAFNGSAAQARDFIGQGFALGLGGAMTYERALRIRRLATGLGLSHWVLETDAPDMPPAWLHPPQRRNRPGELARIAQVLADLRGICATQVAQASTANALRVLPRLAAAMRIDGA